MKQLITGKDVQGDTPYDQIARAWFDHKVDALPEAQRKMLERWMMVDRLIKDGEVVTKVKEGGETEQVRVRYNFSALVEWLRERYGISVRTAYDDIRNAKRFFLSTQTREDVEYARGVQIEWGEMMMHAAFEAGDFDGASKFYKELNKIKGLHEQRQDLPDYSEFIPPTFIITADATELGFERIENKDEIVKRILNEKRAAFMDAEAEDAEEDTDA